MNSTTKAKARAAGLDYFQTGEAAHLVYFVHGFLDDEAVWDDTIAQLECQGVATVQIDLAGMGARIDDSGPIGLERFAADVGAVVDALARPFVIVGQSMGSQVAELVAAARPALARGLVLLSPVPLGGAGLPAAAIEPFASLGGRKEAQVAVREQLTVGLPAQGFARLVARGLPVRAEVVAATANAWNAGHASGREPSAFAGPVLIARGEADGFVNTAMIAASVAHRFANVQVRTVAQAGHWPHAEQPEAVAGLLGEFIDGIDWRASTTVTAQGVQRQGWTDAFEKKSQDSFADAFDPAVTLQASTMARPAEGIEQVKAVMAAASRIYESLAFTHEAVNGSRSYLEWKATAFGGQTLLGVTVLEKNAEGRIVNVAIHHRPLGAALRFSATLRDRLAGVIDAGYFHIGA